jgi:hypothetical protein
VQSNAPALSNDLFVLDTLSGKRGGFFVEAGALDGIQGSNTLLLERDYGWTGICVEPDRGLFAELARNRACVCENACLYRTAAKSRSSKALEAGVASKTTCPTSTPSIGSRANE